ncbi:hypothetical protein ASE14_04320 [Agromyces sp. Root81]|uniref:hypothetical protein n=1 Tax=Agromyces sp. Root81 TaxID=1736601 RepID=UPI0007002718|nr:hypothetical protein [Agromyces sp. Root81]KRC63020.1 hypothetical protein ASE14_04320 [Agromyces sp. Root81]
MNQEAGVYDVEKPAFTAGHATAGEGPPLTPETLDDFVVWAAGVPVGDIDAVRRSIADVQDSAIAESLGEELWKLPVEDVSRHMVLLSIIGELRDPALEDALEAFVWHERLVDEKVDDEPEACTFEARPAEMLQARAAEMLSYLRTESSDNATLRIATEHPSRAVRASAIDAHLFNHDDSLHEIDRLNSIVKAEDVGLVGVARFTRGSDREDFDRAIAEYFDRHPDQAAPAVHPGTEPDPRTDRQ